MISDIFIGLGLFFMAFGVLGVLRFPDVYTRVHASSKCATTGLISILVALIIRNGLSQMSLKIAIIALFALITGPVASHAIAKSARDSGVAYWTTRRGR